MSQPTLIHHFLENSARLYPDKTAVVHEGVRTAFSSVNSRSNALASFLLQSGINPGDRVAILMENCVEYVVSYYGALKASAVAVPLNTDLKLDSLRSILLEHEPRWLIATSRFERLLNSTDWNDVGIQGLIVKAPSLPWSSKPFKVEDLDGVLQPASAPNPALDIQPDALASIIYTSGSTGRPKGVMLSHTNIVSNTLSICEYLHLTHNDIQMVVLPFFYVMGKSLLNTHFAVGGTVVINNKFAFPASVLNEMVTEQVTGFSGVPSTYAYLLHRSPLASFRDKLTSLRYCSQAGGHMSKAIKEELPKVLPEHTQIVVMYGATEASARLSYLEPSRYSDKMDSIGKAIPGVTLRILGEDGKEVPPGQTGELVASGPNIMQGYWKDVESTSNVLVNGHYRTGDEAYQDAEGFFFVVGRKDDQVKVGGHRVNPHEIEDILMESGMLVEAAVLGIPDPLLGHKLVACNVPITKDCTQQDILGYCANRLPKFKIPSDIVLARALPKNSSGKMDRKKCLELVKSRPA